MTSIVITLGSRVWEGGGGAEKSEVSTYSYCDVPKKSGGENSGKSEDKIDFEKRINPVLNIHMDLWV